jgi:hypothetical protein
MNSSCSSLTPFPFLRAFVLSVIIFSAVCFGWWAGNYYQGRVMQNAINLLEMARLNELEMRAKDAYRTQPAAVAIWELQHLAAELAKYPNAIAKSKSARLQLFVVYARLAKLYNEADAKNRSTEAYESAIKYYNGDYPSGTISDFQALLKRLDEFDERTNQRRAGPGVSPGSAATIDYNKQSCAAKMDVL